MAINSLVFHFRFRNDIFYWNDKDIEAINLSYYLNPVKYKT